MKPLLIVNPNGTEAVTERLVQRARLLAPAGLPVRGATARFGARYIAGEVAAAIAGHAALDAYALDAAGNGTPGAVLLGCFGDPGLFALQALAPCPVLGLAEASMRAAAARHGRFVIVTGGARWVPMLLRLARALELDAALAGVHTVQATGAELAADPTRAQALLASACRAALAEHPHAQAVLLGGAALAGMAAPLQAWVERPVLDNVDLALQACWGAMASAPATHSLPADTEPGPWFQLSPALAGLLR
jgi:allantoin racemase